MEHRLTRVETVLESLNDSVGELIAEVRSLRENQIKEDAVEETRQATAKAQKALLVALIGVCGTIVSITVNIVRLIVTNLTP